VAERPLVPPWMNSEQTPEPRGPRRLAFLDKIAGRLQGVKEWFSDNGAGRGILRRLDPAARMGGALLLLIGAALAKGPLGLGVVALSLALGLAVSGRALRPLIRRTLPLFFFTGVVTIPVFFGLSTPDGHLAGQGGGWIGAHLGLSYEGLARGGFFLARSTLMAAVVVFTGLLTTRSEFVRGLGKFPLPGLLVTLVFITIANIWRLLRVLEEVVLARKSRIIIGASFSEREGWFASKARFLMDRAMSTSEEVAMAMASRGFDGRMRTLRTGFLGAWDFLFIGLCAFVLLLAALL